MNRIIVPIVCLVTVGTLISGNLYWNHNLKATAQQAKQSLNTSKQTSQNESKKKTLKEIKKEYTPLFKELEDQETSKLDQLIIEAKAEYVGKKASKSEIVTKYEIAAQQLEQNADKSFNIIYQQLQLDLENNGHSLKEAEEFQQVYNTKKQERANRIISAVKDF